MSMKNAISKAAETKVATRKPKSMKDYVQSMQGEIAKALPSVITAERFTRITLSALSSNRKLMECSPQSFMGAMMTAAQLGVEPNTPLGQAYLIPYRNHGNLECQFQLGYKGLIDLAYRSGEVSTISAHTVYENDEFEYELGLNPKLRHVPATTNRGVPTMFYAVFNLKDGGYGFEVMSVEDAHAHAQRFSKSANNGPWKTNFEEMAKKTVLKKALKYAPLKSDFAREVAADGGIKNYDDDTADILDAESEPIEAEGYVVDEDTGEVKEPSETTTAPSNAK